MQQTNNIHNIKLNWAGLGRPSQLGRTQPQRCWADFGPKMDWADLGPKKKTDILLWARPGPEGRTGPGSAWPRPKRAGGINFPPPLHAERYSFCMQKEKQIKTRKRGGERRVTWRGVGGDAGVAAATGGGAGTGAAGGGGG